MVWTYGAAPETSDRDAVRLLVGDVDTNDQQLTDAEVAFFNAEESNIYMAASAAAKALAAKFARLIDQQIGDLRISYSQRRDAYLALEASLRARGTARAGGIFAGGISKDDKQTEMDDDDRVVPAFKRAKHDNPTVGGPTIDPDLKNW